MELQISNANIIVYRRNTTTKVLVYDQEVNGNIIQAISGAPTNLTSNSLGRVEGWIEEDSYDFDISNLPVGMANYAEKRDLVSGSTARLVLDNLQFGTVPIGGYIDWCLD